MGHDLYKLFVDLHSPMLHAMIQNRLLTGSGEEDSCFAIYSHGGHLVRMTWTIYIYV